jgi:hypothetical protein
MPDLFDSDEIPEHQRAVILKLNAVALAEAVDALSKVDMRVFEWPMSLKSVRSELVSMAALAKSQAKL